MQKTRFAPMLVAALFALPVAARAQETQDTMKLAAPLRTARATFRSALTALKPHEAGALFADSAVVDFQGQVYTGKAAAEGWLVESMQGLSALRFGEPTFTPGDKEVVERNSYTVVTPDGEQQGNTETAWRKMADGSWKVVRLRVT